MYLLSVSWVTSVWTRPVYWEVWNRKKWVEKFGQISAEAQKRITAGRILGTIGYIFHSNLTFTLRQIMLAFQIKVNRNVNEISIHVSVMTMVKQINQEHNVFASHCSFEIRFWMQQSHWVIRSWILALAHTFISNTTSWKANPCDTLHFHIVDAHWIIGAQFTICMTGPYDTFISHVCSDPCHEHEQASALLSASRLLWIMENDKYGTNGINLAWMHHRQCELHSVQSGLLLCGLKFRLLPNKSISWKSLYLYA